MYYYHFEIAGLTIEIATPLEISFHSGMRPFEIFENEKEKIGYQLKIDYEFDGLLAGTAKKDCYIIETENGFIREKEVYKNGETYQLLLVSQKDVNQYSLCIPKGFAETAHLFDGMNIWDFLAFEEPLLYHQGFILHSSFISWQNNGILFTAPSGTGKSTQADLWKKYEDADIYNGDRTIIRKIEGKYYGFGSPYAGSSGIYRNESAPIKAIVVIDQGPDNVIRRLRGREAFLPLFRETLMNTWNKEYMEKMTDLLMDAACQIPVYHLFCRPDQDAVNTVKNEILQEL